MAVGESLEEQSGAVFGGGLQDALGWLAEADEAVQEAWLGVSG